MGIWEYLFGKKPRGQIAMQGRSGDRQSVEPSPQPTIEELIAEIESMEGGEGHMGMVESLMLATVNGAVKAIKPVVLEAQTPEAKADAVKLLVAAMEPVSAQLGPNHRLSTILDELKAYETG